jgi:hypothetical protein
MTHYVEAYERAKVLKQEYDQKFNVWLELSTGSADQKVLLVAFKEIKKASDRLERASWDLLKVLGKSAKMPDDFVVNVLTS